MSVNISQIGGTAIAKNSGNKDNGTQRVCIASDDINLAQIKTDIQSMQADIDAMKTKLDDLYVIMNDVYNSAAHSLKVSVL